MRILILGGDGYLGWPTAMRFSAGGHEVHAVDSYLRRRAVAENATDSLTPVQADLPARAAAWREVSGHDIQVTVGDLCDPELVDGLFRGFAPDAVIHYGEMPSAPYSMASREHAVFTQYNNVVGTLNVLFAMRDLAPDAHLVKLGTMGEYGTATDETRLDERLLTRFDYDEMFGTTLNRFCLQAVIGHPLTVYGAGGQTRGFLNIVDTLRCVELAASNPPPAGGYRVFNQFTESFTVLELAQLVARA